MKTLTFTRNQILLAIITWFAVFFALEYRNFNGLQLLNIIGFFSLAILPGLLTIIAIKIKGLPFWGYATLAVGFSLLELMIVGLLGNTVLPFLGIARPLDKPTLLLEIFLLVGVLAAVVWIRTKDITITIKPYLGFGSLRDLILSLIPILFVLLSIFGAFRLNNGGNNILTMIMLGGMGIYFLVLLKYCDACDENTLPTAIFFMALSLLLMTSFRGWFVTGHDIQLETQFFELSKNAGFWNITASSDPYNACLSITILPTIFTNLLNIADQYIFKFFFQIFFALCPVLVYLIGRNWTNRRIAFMTGVYFMAFPTFFTDMPFIVRQEIAFVFFGLMLYLIFEPNLSIRARRILFVIMGLGVILSHYSTTYTVLVILGMAVIARPLFIKSLKIFKLPTTTIPEKSKITIFMVVLLLILSVLWTSTITHTGDQLKLDFEQTVAAIQGGFTGNNRSIDAMNLLSFTKASEDQELQGYVKNIVTPLRNAASPGSYFPETTYDRYPIATVNNQPLPLTTLGQIADDSGINIGNLSAFFAELLSKLMEILAPLGIIYVLFKKSIFKNLDIEIYLISFFCLVFIFLNLVLPVLSAEYGVFRAMQQSLFVLGFFIVLGSDVIGEWLVMLFKKIKVVEIFRSDSRWFSSALIVIFFFYSTTFIPELIGDNVPDLHLNDSGTYYDNFVTKGTEVNAIDWLVTTLSSQPQESGQIQFAIGADRLSTRKFESLADLTPGNDIFPALVRTNSYVFLGEGTINGDQASFSYNGDLVGYSYPIQFLDDNKNLIYNDGGSRVYR